VTVVNANNGCNTASGPGVALQGSQPQINAIALSSGPGCVVASIVTSDGQSYPINFPTASILLNPINADTTVTVTCTCPGGSGSGQSSPQSYAVTLINNGCAVAQVTSPVIAGAQPVVSAQANYGSQVTSITTNAATPQSFSPNYATANQVLNAITGPFTVTVTCSVVTSATIGQVGVNIVNSNAVVVSPIGLQQVNAGGSIYIAAICAGTGNKVQIFQDANPIPVFANTGPTAGPSLPVGNGPSTTFTVKCI